MVLYTAHFSLTGLLKMFTNYVSTAVKFGCMNNQSTESTLSETGCFNDTYMGVYASF